MTYKNAKESEHESNWMSQNEYTNYDVLEQEKLDPDQLCMLQRFQPFHNSAVCFVRQMTPTVCDTEPQLTYLDNGGTLCLNSDGANVNIFIKFLAGINVLDCYYSEVIRVNSTKETDSFKFNTSKLLSADREVSHTDFIRVQCFIFKIFRIYQNLHINFRNVPIFDSVTKHVNKKYNVLLFGIDQLSRLNAMRQLPKTYGYLNDVLKSVTFRGYHQVEDTGLFNLLTLLTGSHPLKEPWMFPNFEDTNKGFDELPFVWKNYSKAGYRTLLAENSPDLSVFNYKNKKFKVQPTDHYTRTFWLAAKSVLKEFSDPNDCLRNYANHQLHMEHVQKFIERMDDYDPFWAFSFIQGIANNDLNEIGIADDDFFFFLRDLHENGNLDNTILLFFGGRGQTFADMSETPVGHVESTMPLFTIYVPDSFIKHQPHAFRNLQENRFRLTSTFDAYCTLVDILKLSVDNSVKTGKFMSSKGMSLFGKISQNRTCADIGIDNKHCTCIKS